MTKPLTPTPQHVTDRLKMLATQLQENPIWGEVLDTMEAEYTTMWKNSKPVDTINREHAYQMIQAVTGLRTQLQSFTQLGRLSPDIAQKNVKR